MGTAFLPLLLLIAFAASALAAEQKFVSDVRAITPPVSGLEAEVLDSDRALELRNESGRTVIVKGYDNEPYLRFRPNGVVDVNERSPAKFVNEDRYASVEIPASANFRAKPRWQPVGKGGIHEWIDHRIHLTTRGLPPQVKDRSKRTKIFDWKVPTTVEGRPVQVVGTLSWVPESSSSGTSTGLIVALAALAVLAAVITFLLLRRRRRAGPRPKPEKAGEEAW